MFGSSVSYCMKWMLDGSYIILNGLYPTFEFVYLSNITLGLPWVSNRRSMSILARSSVARYGTIYPGWPGGAERTIEGRISLQAVTYCFCIIPNLNLSINNDKGH